MENYPFLVLVISVAFIIVSIGVFRVHAFLALILAATLVGFLSQVPLPDDAPDKNRPQAVLALEVTTQEFGKLAGKIGIVIVLASVLGKCLMDSGGADQITRRFLALFGERFAGVALLVSGFVLSIPVFFDTVFFMLVPFAKAFCMRTGKNYVLYILAIGAGGVITHSLVAPTPGPLAMAETLEIDLGVSILVGVGLGVVPAIIGGWFFSRWMNSRIQIPLRDIEGFSIQELEQIVAKPEKDLPPFWLSILPIILPVLLITGSTLVDGIHRSLQQSGGDGLSETVRGVFGFLGNKNFALFTATSIAVGVLVRQRRLSLRELTRSLEPAIAAAGVIILITSAGGAFGAMIKNSGIESAIKTAMLGKEAAGSTILLLAFGIAAVLKIAQGSGTVAMITTAGIMKGLVGDQELPYHPTYVFAAIGFGSLVVSWMNDSGFWIVSKMSGFTEKETLRTWTVLLVVLAFLGLAEVLVLSQILPLKGLP